MQTKRKERWLQLVCGIAIGSGLLTAQADYAAKVLANNPVAYWRLNDKVQVPKGDVANNLGSLGAAVDGYYLGTSTHPVSGALVGSTDTAVAFDAVAGTIVNIPYSAAMNPSGAFTAEVWLNPNVEHAAGSGTLTCAIASGQFASPRSGWLIYQSETGWNLRMYNQNGTATSVSITGGPAPVAGTWHHVVAVYNGTTAFVYVNGVQKASANPTGYVPSAGGSLFVGGRSDASFWWNGNADEVAIYDKALTAAEIDAHYKNGISASPAKPYNQLVLESGPLGYYRLNEDVYTPPTTLPVAKNSATSGAVNNGSWNPGANALATGPQPPAQSGFEADNTAGGFNGLGGSVTTSATLNDLAAFTIMGWIKRGAIHSGRGGYFGQNDLIEFGDAGGGTTIEAWINASNGNIIVPYPFRDNDWGFLALVGDGTKVTMYANGLPIGSLSGTVASYGSSAFNFNIGGGGIFNATGDPFFGTIDEVAFFDKALTASQVQDIFFEAKTAPDITTQPAAPARDVYVGNTVTLSVVAVGNPPLTYQWRKGGADLGGKTAASLVFANITADDAGTYDVVVTNPYGSTTSKSVTLAVKPAETTLPVLQYATGNRTFNGVRVWFSEPLDPVSAQRPENYTLSEGVKVTGAMLSAPAGTPGDNIVDLVTTTLTPEHIYTLTVTGVKDQVLPANTVAPGSTVQFSAWVVVAGLEFEHYDNLAGAADSDITSALKDPRVIAATPTTSGFVTGAFDTRTVFPDDSHETYLARMTGWITPTETGDYYFFLASDDASRLYLSGTESIPDPATATPIANEPDCCGGFFEIDSGNPSTTANPIHLVAGKRYGVLALLKEGGGGDWLRVGWRESGDSTPAADVPNLPGQFLSTSVDPNVDLAYVKQPTDQQGFIAPPGIDFATRDFGANAGGMTVVNTEPPPPGPWAYDAANGQWAADGAEGGCTGPYNSQLNSTAFVVPADDDVTITFSHRYSFEAPLWDGGQVRISVNGGAFTPVPPANFLENGYALGNLVGNGVMLGQRAFNGNSPGYSNGDFITSKALLGTFKKNDTVVVQFLGAWDDCTTADVPGWVIKNFKLAYGPVKPSIFSAEATAKKRGNPVSFTYQWQRDDGAGFSNLPNENAATYRIFPVEADFKARFRVLVKVPGKELASNVVKLTKDPPGPPVISIASPGGTVTITFTGKLTAATKVDGTYTEVIGAQSPYPVANPTTMMFYRAEK